MRALVLVRTERFVERLRALGFAYLTQEGDYYGYSLALGSAGTHARQGRDAGSAAFLVSDILADRAARSVTFGLDSALGTTSHSAVKTGTSKDMRDNWCIGYSPRYTIGVWVGNFSGEPMHEVSGVTGAAPVWHEVMDHLHWRTGHGTPSPQGVVAEDLVFTPPIEAPRPSGSSQAPRCATSPHHLCRHRGAPPAHRLSRLRHDPGIPAERQRLFRTAEPALPGLAWQLDRVPFISTAPIGSGLAAGAGRHHLTLLDPNGRVVDSVVFEVRGRR